MSMSSSDKARTNDEYGWIDRYAADLHRSAKELVEKGEAARVSDDTGFFNLKAAGQPGHLVEFVELPADVHPFFVATQAHPELKSRPTRPHPLFAAFVNAALRYKTAERLPL